jgi:co-chaperonin GroES (HSP10)
MASLILPEHVAEKIEAEDRAKNKAPAGLEKAYVSEDQRVLDPALLDTPLLDRMPDPTGWRVLVMPYQGKTKTAAGLHIPDEVRDREALATVVAYVLKVGPLAYEDPDKFGVGEPWCKAGDWVCIGRYSGSRFKIDGGEVRLINDDEVIATILDPDDIKHI